MRSGCSIKRGGFTLLEVMVCITVISLLLGILLPALGIARRQGESVTCTTRLRGLGQGLALDAGQNDGFWMNLFANDLDASLASYTCGTVEYEFGYFNQVRLWPGGLIGILWEDGDPADVWTCPAVQSRGYGLFDGPGQLNQQPADGGIMSYFYSATLISDWRLWDPTNPPSRDDPDRFRRRVNVHEVRFPSHKGAMSEVADYHGREIRFADDPAAGSLSTLFCDGSARRVDVAEVAVGLPTERFFDSDPDQEIVPFLGTPLGVLGDDLPTDASRQSR